MLERSVRHELTSVIPNPVACLWRTAVRDLLFTPTRTENAGQLRGQILPCRIVALDEPDFLFPPPTLDFFLAANCLPDVSVRLEVHETENAIAGGEARDKPAAVFDHATN